MKLVFSTLDVITVVEELRKHVVGSRVNNIYDVNNKTYLLKFARNEEKLVVLIESGARIHLTEFEWVKNVMPSGFAMKLRKHIRNRKVAYVNQLGMDRIVDIQFGFDENAFHLITELYDRVRSFALAVSPHPYFSSTTRHSSDHLYDRLLVEGNVYDLCDFLASKCFRYVPFADDSDFRQLLSRYLCRLSVVFLYLMN
ncbi:hypothetical protein P879_09400 [Paragonimus westermani]|uniref:Uncharacterized protein n=1 Tax=Paragonimus westermani TaxID=34504 RepID=A0A8T0DER2_9TREM|nr:hypothetical protein P879_09400 [Paragonimus westermani]